MRVPNRRRILALILPVSLTALFLAWRNPTRSAPIQKHNVALAQLPLSFEVNRGQAAADAKFVACGGGYALLMFGFPLAVRRRNLVWLRSAAALGLASLLLLVAGCGGGSDPQSPPQPVTVNITVSATSGSTTASIPFAIAVR